MPHLPEELGVDDGRFESFWPPAYTAAYGLPWVVENGSVTGCCHLDLFA